MKYQTETWERKNSFIWRKVSVLFASVIHPYFWGIGGNFLSLLVLFVHITMPQCKRLLSILRSYHNLCLRHQPVPSFSSWANNHDTHHQDHNKGDDHWKKHIIINKQFHTLQGIMTVWQFYKGIWSILLKNIWILSPGWKWEGLSVLAHNGN